MKKKWRCEMKNLKLQWLDKIPPPEERNPELFYYDIRNSDIDNGYTIDRGVLVNNIGSLVTNKDILKDKIKTIDFKENNNRTYAVCISSKKITQKENAYIKGKINKNTYYINVDSTKNLIEIHLNNLIEINNGMDQEVIENNVFTE